uniref:Uncharacterized protein n=1 Tax=Anopheles albimanus TaxID=7167 RepID=A0A182FY84_ANOAL
MDVAETEHGDKRKTVNQVNSKCNSERDEAATMAYHIEQPDSLGAYDCPWKVAHREPTGQRRYQYKPCWRKASQGFVEQAEGEKTSTGHRESSQHAPAVLSDERAPHLRLVPLAHAEQQRCLPPRRDNVI